MKIYKKINLPEVAAFSKYADVARHLVALKKAIFDRDEKIAAAINQYDVEVLAAAPTDPPESPAPVFRLVDNAGTWTLWIYTGETGGWKSIALS